MPLRKLRTETTSLTMRSQTELGKSLGPMVTSLTTVKKRKLKWIEARIKINRSCKKILQGTVQTSFEGISRRSPWGAGKKLFQKKVYCTCRVVVLLTKPIAFLKLTSSVTIKDN